MNELAVAIVGVVGILLGTILGWILNNLTHSGRIYCSNAKFEFTSESNTIIINKVENTSDKRRKEISGQVCSCTLKFNIINLATYDKVIREIGLNVDKRKIKNISVWVEKDGHYSSCTNNSINLNSKEYKNCEIIIPIEVIESLKHKDNKIKLTYLNKRNRRKKIFIGKIVLLRELDAYKKNFNKV
ncbi:hypothetical protein [Anaerotignum sp.]|uniref:hypothetical protein n=1 Tax=Anaerotignum sp. TaxID=2039241 RepID=UPI002714EA4B|nr:hypothetical protein [Anaerotignum sp.]